jgi:hypothetical protein
MVEKIEREKKQEQHLFYTSLKYTKTGDVMVNVIKKMAEVMALAIDEVLKSAKKKKLISSIPSTPKEKTELMKSIFKKDKEIIEMLDFYEIARKVENYKRVAEGEFRKGVRLKLFINDEVLTIDVEKLTEIQKKFEGFIEAMEKFIRAKS